MKKTNKVIISLMMVVMLLMGVGYAALEAVDLTITGTATASANAANFKVYFSGTAPVVSDAKNVTASAAAQAIQGTVNFSGMDTVGQTQHAIFEIVNGSDGIDAASVKVTKAEEDTDYFDVIAVMCDANGAEITGDNPLAAGAKTYVKVSAQLKKNPLSDNTTTRVEVVVTAEPDVD